MKELQIDQFTRQGDVVVQRVPDRARQGAPGSLVLAVGETQGHAHTICALKNDTEVIPPAAVFELNGERILFVDRPCQLTHQTHRAHMFMPGVYRVIQQREFTPDASRPVAD